MFKIIREQALGIIIINNYLTQDWIPVMAQCLNRLSYLDSINNENFTVNTRQQPNTFSNIRSDTPCSTFIWIAIEARYLPQKIDEVFCDSWRTKFLYFKIFLSLHKCLDIISEEDNFLI